MNPVAFSLFGFLAEDSCFFHPIGDFFPEHWKKADVKSLMRIQDSILRCKRYKASNIGWTANAEGLMQSIAEEATKWQL